MNGGKDWFVERCPDCGAWCDVTCPVFEKYGCVTCALLAQRVVVVA